MSAATDIDVDLSILEALDWSIPCEHQAHESIHVPTESASWVMTFVCPTCGQIPEMLFCDSGKRRIMTVRAITHGNPENPDTCGETYANEEWVIKARPLDEKEES